MDSPWEGTTFLFMWLGFLVLMLICIASFFLWAIRRNQFTDQDRARYLPLMSGIPAADDPQEEALTGRSGS
ncbi:hypothetical protein GMLC_12230 [Geomonas limicola]|uniref:Cytochrome oxidase maturation protein Cbb3 n=1 Tax=Geomonas limicola TaxID=2740186 RepID=A0A6V8N6T2_9BACT|nr:cbb3-type cytochrome oxidase assembly protein CcoS [Geomonas limicola]GFO67644.1 hypothetical protein GMLC_12230 [Geomonas limicola]